MTTNVKQTICISRSNEFIMYCLFQSIVVVANHINLNVANWFGCSAIDNFSC